MPLTEDAHLHTSSALSVVIPLVLLFALFPSAVAPLCICHPACAVVRMFCCPASQSLEMEVDRQPAGLSALPPDTQDIGGPRITLEEPC